MMREPFFELIFASHLIRPARIRILILLAQELEQLRVMRELEPIKQSDFI